MTTTNADHWNDVYGQKREDEVSWFQGVPSTSLELVDRCVLAPEAPILDVGSGASRLVDALLDRGFSNVTALDISHAALEVARARLGKRSEQVRWIEGDVTAFKPESTYALWHDRAVFHFLTTPEARAAYVRALSAAVAPGGYVIIATFALGGPERCSGLPVVRYDAGSIAAALGLPFSLVESLRHEHQTPGGRVQPFTFARLRRDR